MSALERARGKIKEGKALSGSNYEKECLREAIILYELAVKDAEAKGRKDEKAKVLKVMEEAEGFNCNMDCDLNNYERCGGPSNCERRKATDCIEAYKKEG